MAAATIEKNNIDIGTERATIISALLKLRTTFSCHSCEESYGCNNDRRCVNVNMLVNHKCGHFFCSECWNNQRKNKSNKSAAPRCPVCNIEVTNELDGVKSANHFFYPLMHNFENLVTMLKQKNSRLDSCDRGNESAQHSYKQISPGDQSPRPVENRNDETNGDGTSSMTSSMKLMISSRNKNGGRASFGVKYVSPQNNEINVSTTYVGHNVSNCVKKKRKKPKRLSLHVESKRVIEVTNYPISTAVVEGEIESSNSFFDDKTDKYASNQKPEATVEDFEFHSQTSLPNECLESPCATKVGNLTTNNIHYSINNKEVLDNGFKIIGKTGERMESNCVEKKIVSKESSFENTDLSKCTKTTLTSRHQSSTTTTNFDSTDPLISNKEKQASKECCASPNIHTPSVKEVDRDKSSLFFPLHSPSPPFEADQESTSSEHPPQLKNDKIIEYFEPEDEYENTYLQDPENIPISCCKPIFHTLCQSSSLTSYSQQSLTSEHPPESVETFIEHDEFPQFFDENPHFQSPPKSQLRVSIDHNASPDSLERELSILDNNIIFDGCNFQRKINVANENYLAQGQGTNKSDFIQNQCKETLKEIQFQTIDSQTSSQEYVPGTCQEIGDMDIGAKLLHSDMKLNSLFGGDTKIINHGPNKANCLPDACNDDFLSQDTGSALVEGTDPCTRIAETQCIQKDCTKMSLNAEDVTETKRNPESPCPLNLTVINESKPIYITETPTIYSNEKIVFQTEPQQESNSAKFESQGVKNSVSYRNNQMPYYPDSPLVDDLVLSMKPAALEEEYQLKNSKKQNSDNVSLKYKKAANSVHQIMQKTSGREEPKILDSSYSDSKEEICRQNSRQEENILFYNHSSKMMNSSDAKFKDFEYPSIKSKKENNIAMITLKKENKSDGKNAVFGTKTDSKKEESTNETYIQKYNDRITKDTNLEDPVENVASPDILKEDRNMMKQLILCLDFMTNEDLDKAHQLQSDDICIFRKEIGYFKTIDDSNKESSGKKICPTSIKFQCTSHLIMHSIPKFIQRKEITLTVKVRNQKAYSLIIIFHFNYSLLIMLFLKKVCVRSFKYLLALALGLEIIESGWLKSDEVGKEWPNESGYRIWGDFALYNLLKQPEENGKINLSKAYAEKLRTKGVCYISKSFIKKVKRKKIPHKLSNYYIALLGFNTSDHSFADMKSILPHQADDFSVAGDSAKKIEHQFTSFLEKFTMESGKNLFSESGIGDAISLTLDEVCYCNCFSTNVTLFYIILFIFILCEFFF